MSVTGIDTYTVIQCYLYRLLFDCIPVNVYIDKNVYTFISLTLCRIIYDYD